MDCWLDCDFPSECLDLLASAASPPLLPSPPVCLWGFWTAGLGDEIGSQGVKEPAELALEMSLLGQPHCAELEICGRLI
jgi:hypothetical protein